MELWCSGLTCLPVTQEVAGSTPVSSASAAVAQSVEQWTENPRVGSSILPCGTIFFAGVAQLAEQLNRNQQVAGSSPIAGSKTRPSGAFLFLLELHKGNCV